MHTQSKIKFSDHEIKRDMSFTDKPIPHDIINDKAKLLKYIKKKTPLVFLVLFRSYNKNIIVFEANVQNGKFHEEMPVIAYWLVLEEGKGYRATRREQKISHDREELSFLDRTIAYNFTTKKENETCIIFSFSQFEKKLIIILQDKIAKCFMYEGDQKYLVSYVFLKTGYINMISLTGTVDHITVGGINLHTKKREVIKLK